MEAVNRMAAAMSGDGEGRERLITIAEYEQMPEEDLYRVDLVRGMLVRSPIPAPLHGVLQIRIGRKLDEFVEHAGGGVVTGEVGAILARDPDTVRGPDVAFYSTERIPESGYSGGFWGPPDLAVEILSPSNRASEVRAKIADYLEAGVRLVWVLNPQARSVTIHRPGVEARVIRDDQTVEGEDVLPGFRLPLAAFFAL
jgi:Uma2 family endonuclease